MTARRRTGGGPERDRLVHPRDLGAWRTWFADRNRLREAWRRRRADAGPTGVVTTTPRARILVVLDATTPSNLAALAEPVRFLDPADVAILAPGTFHGRGPDARTVPVATVDDLARAAPRVRVVVTAGAHLPLSAWAHDLAERAGLRTFVVQHGALTPFSPPLPPTTLLAWSEVDGAFWRSGRDDVTVEVTGSQLLWSAGTRPAAMVDPSGTPTFLGQLHGAELSRASVYRIARDFCRATGAHYRPHPSERDKLSRLGHRILRASGVDVTPGAGPLHALDTPVVGMFSSGILEAAAAGLPTWGHHPDPPGWLLGFWDRYGIAPWGLDPTQPPPRSTTEPAERVARIVDASIGDPT